MTIYSKCGATFSARTVAILSPLFGGLSNSLYKFTNAYSSNSGHTNEAGLIKVQH